MPVTVTPLLRLILALFAVVACGSSLHAQDAAERVHRIGAEAVQILDHPGVLRESAAELTMDDFLDPAGAAALFRPLDREIAAPGYSDRGYWLHTRLYNPDSRSAERVLAIDNPLLDRVDFYLRQPEGRLVRLRNGDTPSAGEGHAVAHALLTVPPTRTVDVYVRVQSNDALPLPLLLYQPDAYADHAQSVRFWLGLLIGALVALAAYNLLLWITLRKRAYLWFVAHLLSFSVLIAALNGLGLSQWNDLTGDRGGGNLIHAGMSLAMMCMLAYTSCLMQLSRQWPAAMRLLTVLSVLRGLLAIAALFVPAQWLSQLSIGLLVPETLAIIGCCGVMIGRGSSSARLLLGGWSLLLLALLAWALVAFGVLPANVLASHGPTLGLLVGATVITFASALRYESLHSQYENVALIASTGLEKGVAERTRTLAQTMAALNEANQRLREANDRDGLTGVFNRRYFDRNIEGMLAKSRIAQQPFSALVADIDHFKSVNDSAGHLVGDDCIRLVARVLQEAAGTAGSVVRYGGEEFVVLLPGHSVAAAIALAERIRTAVAAESVTTRTQVIRLTISIGVATTAANRRLAAATLIRDADQALYAAKGDGRNRVIHADSLRRIATTD